MSKDTQKKHSIFAPFYIIKSEKFYIWWVIFIFFFGLINIWADLLLGKLEDIKASLLEGQLYTFSIALCSPFIVSFLLDYLISRKYRKEHHFVTYKVVTLLINIVWLTILSFLWIGIYKSSTNIQIITCVLSILFSFYMFCVEQMQVHSQMMEPFDDKEYLDDEKSSMEQVANNAEKLTHMDDDGGKIQL